MLMKGGGNQAAPQPVQQVVRRWPPENAHTALRLLLETRWVAKLFPKEEDEDDDEEGFNDEDEGKRTTTSSITGSGDDSDDDDKNKLKKKTNKDEKKEDSIRRLESRYRGIKVDLLDAPRECAMRTCLVHCGAREAKLEGVDGREEEEMGDAETIYVGAGGGGGATIRTTTTEVLNSNKVNEVIDDRFKIRSKTAKVGVEIVKKCLDMDEESHAQHNQLQANNGQPPPARHFVMRMLLPTGQCGQCIGKGGANIKRLREKAPRCEVKIHDVGQIPPCATAEDRVLEMIGAREDIEIVAAELFETLSYFHFDKSVLPYFVSLAVCNRSPQQISAVVDQYGRNVGGANRVHTPPNMGAAVNVSFPHQQFPGQSQLMSMVVPSPMLVPTTIVSPPYNPVMVNHTAASAAASTGSIGNGAFQDPVAAAAQAQQVAAAQMMQQQQHLHHQQQQQMHQHQQQMQHQMNALSFAPDFLGGFGMPSTNIESTGGGGVFGGAFAPTAHEMATNANAPVAAFGQARAMRYNPVAIGPAGVPLVPVASATLSGEVPVSGVPVSGAINPAMASMFSGGGFPVFNLSHGVEVPDIVQTTTPAGATMPVIPTQMLAHSKEDKEDTTNRYAQFFTSTNNKLNVWSDNGDVAAPNPDPLNIINFLPGDDLYAFDEDANGNVNYAQAVPVVNDEQDEFTEMAKISIPKTSLGIVLGEGSANTRVVARMSDCYISVAVDPNPNAEEATICMLGKTEDAVENAKDALEALALGAESHPHY
jgi:transcription antitermination factor NusA-like protein